MKKSDKREKLAAVLTEMMTATPIEEIHTQELCERAGVSKSTFYRLFTDKYDLAFWIYKNEADGVVKDMPKLNQWGEWTERIFDAILRNKAFYRNYASYRGQNSLFECLLRYYQQNIFQYRQKQEVELTEDQRFALYVFSLAGAQATVDWICNGFTPSAEVVNHRMELCLPECLREFYQ